MMDYLGTVGQKSERSVRLAATSLVVLLTLALGGCVTTSNQGVSGAAPVNADSIPVSPAGITRVNDVIVTPVSGNQYRLMAAGKSSKSRDDFLAVLWCRAKQLARKKGFANWKPRQLQLAQQQNKSSPTVAIAHVELLKAPPKKPGTIDWCKRAKG